MTTVLSSLGGLTWYASSAACKVLLSTPISKAGRPFAKTKWGTWLARVKRACFEKWQQSILAVYRNTHKKGLEPLKVWCHWEDCEMRKQREERSASRVCSGKLKERGKEVERCKKLPLHQEHNDKYWRWEKNTDTSPKCSCAPALRRQSDKPGCASRGLALSWVSFILCACSSRCKCFVECFHFFLSSPSF